jgi:hypothetical protein
MDKEERIQQLKMNEGLEMQRIQHLKMDASKRSNS